MNGIHKETCEMNEWEDEWPEELIEELILARILIDLDEDDPVIGYDDLYDVNLLVEQIMRY